MNLLDFLMRKVLGRLISRGIRQSEEGLSPAGRKQARQARMAAKRARQMARLGRRTLR